MDRELSEQQKRTPWIRAGLRLAVGIGLVFGIGWTAQRLLSPAVELADLRVATIERGPIESTVTTTGTIVPRSEQIVSSPASAEVLAVHVSLGESVEKGQVIMVLDTTASALELSNLEEQIALKRAELRSVELQRADAVRQARSSRELLGIDLESREVMLGRLRTLSDSGAVSDSEILEAELNVKRTRVQIEQIDAEILSLEQRREADIERIALDLSMLDKRREDQARRVAQSTVRSPRSGLITSLVRDAGAVVTEAQALATVAAEDAFAVEAGVSDFYGPQLKPRQRVRISSSTSEFPGYVNRILPSADSARLDLFIELDDPTAPAFHTNLRVDIEIVTAAKADALRVRRGPALESAGLTDIFVIEGSRAVRRPVRLGISERRVIEIVEGAEAGERIIVSDMSGYEELEEIRISQ